MNLHNSVSHKMEYIQNVFLGVQDYMQKNHGLEELIVFLDDESPEFRSVAYESASMGIALLELSNGGGLGNWKNFYQRSASTHTFHMDIGLGWAFAKKEMSPVPYLESIYPVKRCMVFDGMGYYNGLFNGRKTVRNQLIPGEVNVQNMNGFDQGLGRRLWYISRGDVNEVTRLIQSFQFSRRVDLWRGVGIACGYVGGNDESNLEQLLKNSAEFKEQLRTGITFAGMSRSASNSVTEDIELACKVICGKPLNVVLNDVTGISNLLDSIAVNDLVN